MLDVQIGEQSGRRHAGGEAVDLRDARRVPVKGGDIVRHGAVRATERLGPGTHPQREEGGAACTRAHVNTYGNISDISVGPIHMAPYDTVPFVVALVGAADSASMEAGIDNSIAFYNQLFLGPETAPPPRITAVDVVPGQDAVGQTAPGSSITLFFDDTAEEWRDPFLEKLDVSADIELNPWLQDSVDVRTSDNVTALHIFKSCDGGTTFTQDGDCDGDPVSDPTSKWSGFGWQPYQTVEAGPGGTLPNVFEDLTVQPGVSGLELEIGLERDRSAAPPTGRWVRGRAVRGRRELEAGEHEPVAKSVVVRAVDLQGRGGSEFQQVDGAPVRRPDLVTAALDDTPDEQRRHVDGVAATLDPALDRVDDRSIHVARRRGPLHPHVEYGR